MCGESLGKPGCSVARYWGEHNVGVIVHGNSFIDNELCRAVKYKYCPECKKAYIKSRLEKDKCIYCGKPCEVVEVRRNHQYYLGYGVILLGAAVMLVIRFWFYNTILLWTVGILTILAGGWLVLASSNKMARDAAERIEGQEDATNETGGEPEGEGADEIGSETA